MNVQTKQYLPAETADVSLLAQLQVAEMEGQLVEYPPQFSGVDLEAATSISLLAEADMTLEQVMTYMRTARIN